MVKPTLDDHNAMADVLQTGDFRFTFDRIPGAPDINVGRFSLNCIQAATPSETISKLEQAFPGGHTLTYGGKKTYTRTSAAQFIERVTSESYVAMKKWSEFVRGTKSGNSGDYKPGYSATALLEIYDSTGKVANSWRYINFYVTEIAELQFDGGADATAALWQVTFSYDWAEPSTVALR